MQTNLGFAQKRAQHLVQARPGGAEHQVYTKMIHQVSAHVRRILNHLQPKLLHQRTGPNTGELQQLRRVDGPAAKDHLGAC